MSVQITDCTVRDGGYLLNKDPDPGFIRGVMEGLVAAGIDFVETGFLQSDVTGQTLVYRDSKGAARHLPENRGRTQFLGFCDNSRYSPDALDPYDGNSFKWLRISFAKHEIEPALRFCGAAQDKGYIVQFNPMDTASYSAEERACLIQKVNAARPGSFSIVDTFGAMYLEDLTEIFTHTDSLLDKGIKIGLHSHDNLGLSCALAEQMVSLALESGRDIAIDGSLFGMGRGAGNAKTELLADYLNKKCGTGYDIQALLGTVDRYIVPLLDRVHWGYSLPMYVCGTKHSHVDNVCHLGRRYGCTASELYDVVGMLTPAQRTRYGAGYSKTDFSVLDAAYERYKGGENR